MEKLGKKKEVVKLELKSTLLAKRQEMIDDIRNIERKDLPAISYSPCIETDYMTVKVVDSREEFIELLKEN